MVDADTHPTRIGGKVVDPVRHRAAELREQEVMDPDLFRVALGAIFAPVVAEIADQFLFLGVDAAWLAKWSGKYPKLTGWVEENIDETLSFYRLPRQHHKHLKSTNMLERLNEEIKRRTHVVRIFPNAESCLRLVRALAVETHENWLEQHRYLNMDGLREHKKEALRRAA